jgi:hypothetical protein
MDGAGPQGPVPSEEGASLEQVAVVLRYETISGPHAVLFFQDMKNIGSPFTSPALSVLFCDISDQVRETTLAATHAGRVWCRVHDSELSSLFPRHPKIRCLTVYSVLYVKYPFSRENSNGRDIRRNSFFFSGLV